MRPQTFGTELDYLSVSDEITSNIQKTEGATLDENNHCALKTELNPSTENIQMDQVSEAYLKRSDSEEQAELS